MLCVLRQCTFGLHTFIDWGLGVVIWLKWERIYYRWTNAKEERTDDKLRGKESSINFSIKELAAFHMCENVTDDERGSKKTSSMRHRSSRNWRGRSFNLIKSVNLIGDTILLSFSGAAFQITHTHFHSIPLFEFALYFSRFVNEHVWRHLLPG